MAQNAGLPSAAVRAVRRATPILGLAAHLGHGAQRVVTDAVIGRARSLPRKIEDLDAGFLSRVMGRTVTSVSSMEGLRRGVAALDDLETVPLLQKSLR